MPVSESMIEFSKSLFSLIPNASTVPEKKVLKVSATSLSFDISSSFSTKIILSLIPPLSLNKGLTVFQNFLLSVILDGSRFP